MDLVQVLIENGADLNTPAADVREITTHLLLFFPHHKSVLAILPLYVHYKWQQGDTPLITATKKGMIDVAKQLLDRGADSSSIGKVSYQ